MAQRRKPYDLPYNVYLRDLGYDADNPWHDYADAAAGEDGEILSGWLMRNAPKPARVKEEHSETAYMTDRAIQLSTEVSDAQWCLHLSYIKPHWPYIAPAPYHAMYGAGDIIPVNRSARERKNPHPVHRRLYAARGKCQLFPFEKCGGVGDPGLYGPDQANRRSSRPALAVSSRNAG